MPDTPIFHITTATRYRKIAKEGILPNCRPQWKNHFGVKQGQRGCIYLVEGIVEAVRWGARMGYETPKADIWLLQVSPPGDIEPDPHPEAGFYGYTWRMTRTAIPPERIEKAFKLTLEHKRALVQGSLEALFAEEKPVREEVPGPEEAAPTPAP